MTMPKVHISRRDFLKIGGSMTGAAALGAMGLPAFAQDVVREDLQGQIVLSLLGNNPDESVIEAMNTAYRTIRPNVELIWEYPGTSADGYPTWLGTQVASEPIRPDVVSGNYFPNFEGYVNFEQYRYLTNPHTGRTWDEDLDWNFFVSKDEQGERYMLPTRAVHINFFYNKDMFAQAGVEIPTTWDEFEAVCAALQAALPDVAPVVANYIWQVPQWWAETAFDQYHINWVETVRAQEGDWNFNPEVDGTFVYDPNDPDIHNKYTLSSQRFYRALRDGELRLDTPEVAEAILQTGRIWPKYGTSDFFVIADPYPRFIARQAAIMYNGTWALSTLSNDLRDLSEERLAELQEALGTSELSIEAFEYGTFEMPQLEGPLVKSNTRSVESATGEYVSIIEKDAAQTELTLDFVQWWLSYAGYPTWNDARFEAGATFSGPLKVYDVEEPEEVAALWADVQFLGNAEASYNGFWTSMGGGDMQTSARDIFKQGIEGTITPEDAAAGLQALMMDNFATILETVGLTNEDLDNPARQPGT
jgi:ABC-type glycerol-3-phosphate transport system substrate-binding protein